MKICGCRNTGSNPVRVANHATHGKTAPAKDPQHITAVFIKLYDGDVGCFLQFFGVVMADLTGGAAPWDTCPAVHWERPPSLTKSTGALLEGGMSIADR